MRNFASKASGSPLVATPTVDKNGRLTTVHKRADGALAVSPSLSSSKPALGTRQQTEKTHSIKPKKLAKDSSALRVGIAMGYLRDHVDEEEFRDAGQRKPVTMADDVLYDFLRQGVDVQSAAAMNAFGVSSCDDIPSEAWDRCFPGSLSTAISKNRTVHHKKFDDVLDRFQVAGVSAVDASKAITNGLQDAHLDRALSDEQLLHLFSKWTYKSVCGVDDRSTNEQDNVINGLVSGLIPYELSSKNLNVLKGLEYELDVLITKGQAKDQEDKDLVEKLKDRGYLLTLGNRVEAMEGYRPLRALNRLVEDHGFEVLDLEHPQMAGVSVGKGEGKHTQIGVEPAKYIEEVHRIAHESSDRAYWMSDRFTSYGGLEVDRTYLRNYELNDLRKAGVSPEKAYDMLVNHKLSPEQVIVAHQTGLNDSLAQGAL